MTETYSVEQPARSDVDGWQGPTLLQFGTNWCGHCKAAQPLVAQTLAQHPGVRHVMVEDGSGRVLGRSFSVTLWPTLVFLRDGQVVGRLVRPVDGAPIINLLDQIDAAAG
ncbi:MAG: thioredoxin family protein [Burkholderiaceae bacterium]